MALQGLVLAWLPRVDGVFLTEPPQYSVLRGHVSDVPVITGTSLCCAFIHNSFVPKETAMMRAPYFRSPPETFRT
jgi:hypothetical protein